jgi:integrase
MNWVQKTRWAVESLSVVRPEHPIVWSHKRNRTASLKMKEPKGKLRWLTQVQAKKLTDTLLHRWEANQGDMVAMDSYDLTCVLLDTGCRYDEIAKITWDQVDRHSGHIDLYRNKTDNESKLLNTKRVKTIMERRWAMQQGRYSYVLPALRGRNWAGLDKPRGHATAGVQGVLDRMGLNDDQENTRMTPHSFRDNFASWLVQAGVSLLKVSKLLGHADVKMTEKYAHLCPAATGHEAMEVLDRMAGVKVAEGDDPKQCPHTLPHSGVTHIQQLISRLSSAANEELVGRTGFEPVTNGLKVRCSTN